MSKITMQHIVISMFLLFMLACLFPPAWVDEAVAVPRDWLRPRIGAFTGPLAGTNLDDNIKAALDRAYDQALAGMLGTSGTIFYCDSNEATGTENGLSWATATDTLDEAINLCTNSVGDIILVAPGHNENIVAANAIDADKIGITIIGLGNGSLKPTIDYDHADAEFIIGASNVTIKNIRFRVSANAVKLAIDIEDDVDHAVIIGCEFGYAETSTDEFTECIVFNDASNYGKVIDCYFDAGSQAAASAIMFDEDTHGTIIQDNIFVGTWATAVIEGATTLSSSLIITDNDIFGIGTADTFNLYAASTGIVARNFISMTAASAATAMDIGNCLNIDNVLIADDDVGGTKAPPDGTAIYASVTASADG